MDMGLRRQELRPRLLAYMRELFAETGANVSV